VAAFKPVVTGTDEPSSTDERGIAWPPDHELLAATASAGQGADAVAPWRFGAPVSPHYAVELAGGRPLEPAEIVAAARRAAAAAEALVCEGVGGLMVPLTPGYLVRDLAVDLGLPVVIAARTGLGTINHTLLTLEAARAAGLRAAGVVMTPWPADPEPLERSNRETVERLGGVAVSGLPPAGPDTLAEAGGALPLDDWLGPG
jgi:dethiobiotin synthetase